MTQKEKIIQAYYDKKNWNPPSYRELAKIFNYKSVSYIHRIMKEHEENLRVKLYNTGKNRWNRNK